MSTLGKDHRVTEHAVSAHPHWFDRRALKPLLGLNAAVLEALVASANASKSPARLPLAIDLAELLATLSAHARGRLAQCPFSLIDAGFDDAERWFLIKTGRMPKRTEDERHAGFGLKKATSLANMTLTLAWSLARSNQDAARLILGMSEACGGVVADIALADLPAIAEQYADLFRPRWEHRPDIWRHLLQLAMQDCERGQPALIVWAMEYFLTDLRRGRSLSGQGRTKVE